MKRVLVIACLAPGVAHAGDGESAASLELAGGTYVLPGEEEDETIAPIAGGVVVATYERGFSEALSWRVELAGAVYGGGGVSWGAAAGAGLVYRFDVLKYVPYAIVGLGGSYLDGGPIPDRVIDPVVLVGGGVDLLKSRDRSYGLEARVASFAGDTTTVSLGVRITHRWGYF